MRFLRPEAVWLLLGALPLLALHLRRLRRRVVPVASIHLWRELAGAGAGRTGFRRLREAGALALLLAALLALTASLAAPVTGAAATRARSLVVILDASVSMNTRDGDATRFESGRAAARQAVARLAADDDVTLWLADGGAWVIAEPTADRGVIARALDGARPTLAPRSLDRALALARRALSLRRVRATLLVISDPGGAASLADEDEIAIAAVGDAAIRNAAVLGVTRTESGVRVHLAQLAGAPGERTLRVTVDGETVAELPAILTAGRESSLDVLVPERVVGASGILEARLVPPDDFVDDDANGLILRSAAPLRVVVTAPGAKVAPFLLEALRAMPSIVDADAALLASPDAAAGVLAAADVVIAEGHLPAALPADRPVLAFLDGPQSVPKPLLWGVGSHPVLDGVNLAPLRLDRALPLTAVASEVVLVDSASGPLAVAGETDGVRRVRLGFRAAASTLPLEPAFPLLVLNALRWLRSGDTLPDAVASEAPIRLSGVLPEQIDSLLMTLGETTTRVSLGPDRADPPAPVPEPGGARLLRLGLPGGASLGTTVVQWRLPRGALDADGEPRPLQAALARLPPPLPPDAPFHRLAPFLAAAAAAFLLLGSFLLSEREPGSRGAGSPSAA